jgi:hypothetical protein
MSEDGFGVPHIENRRALEILLDVYANPVALARALAGAKHTEATSELIQRVYGLGPVEAQLVLDQPIWYLTHEGQAHLRREFDEHG